jgi:hypothetical protein
VHIDEALAVKECQQYLLAGNDPRVDWQAAPFLSTARIVFWSHGYTDKNFREIFSSLGKGSGAKSSLTKNSPDFFYLPLTKYFPY